MFSLCQRRRAFVSMSCTFPSKPLCARGILASVLHKKQEIEANVSLKLNFSPELTQRAESTRGERGGLKSHAAAPSGSWAGIEVSPSIASNLGVSGRAVALTLTATVGQTTVFGNTSPISDNLLGQGWPIREGRRQLCARPVCSHSLTRPTAAIIKVGKKPVSSSPASPSRCSQEYLSHPARVKLFLLGGRWVKNATHALLN